MCYKNIQVYKNTTTNQDRLDAIGIRADIKHKSYKYHNANYIYNADKNIGEPILSLSGFPIEDNVIKEMPFLLGIDYDILPKRECQIRKWLLMEEYK